MSLPHPQFRFTLQSPYNKNRYNKNRGYITLGDEKVHRIENVEHFYEALGYTEEIRKTGLMPEEFIWNEYNKDGSKKTEICLQVKIIEYLNKHSEIYKEKYAAQFESWLTKCLEKMKLNSSECKNCEPPM